MLFQALETKRTRGGRMVRLSDGRLQLAIFLVEEFLEGKTLDMYLEEKFGEPGQPRPTFRGIPDSTNFFDLAVRVALTVRAVHQQSIIHGDIWQTNIMVCKGGELRLFDFGGAAERHTPFLRADPLAAMRRDRFVAPERQKGERHGRRSDIYALGGLFYYMATGQAAPPAPEPEIDTLKNQVVAAMKQYNPCLFADNCGIADIIARCMRYDKNRRIRDADALLAELRLFSFADVAPLSSAPSPQTGAGGASLGDCVACLLDGGGTDPLFAGMLTMQVAQLKSRAEDMKRGILEVSGDHDELVLGMTACLSLLRTSDLFLARITPRFWAEQNMGMNGRFLSMAKLAAQRGARVRNIILACESDKTDPLTLRMLRAHLRERRKIILTFSRSV